MPYYAQIMRELGGGHLHDPEAYLAGLPMLTKDLIRRNLQRLRSDDLARLQMVLQHVGGSTGEPVRFIQDRDYVDRS